MLCLHAYVLALHYRLHTCLHHIYALPACLRACITLHTRLPHTWLSCTHVIDSPPHPQAETFISTAHLTVLFHLTSQAKTSMPTASCRSFPTSPPSRNLHSHSTSHSFPKSSAKGSLDKTLTVHTCLHYIQPANMLCLHAYMHFPLLTPAQMLPDSFALLCLHAYYTRTALLTCVAFRCRIHMPRKHCTPREHCPACVRYDHRLIST